MKIDAHQHFWYYDSRRDAWITEEMAVLRHDFLPNDLQPILQQHKFDGCVAVQADTSEKETQFLLDVAEQHTFVKGVVGWLDLCDKTIDERLEHFIKHEKLKGLRHIVQGEPDGFMLRDDFQHGISYLAQYNLSYDILIFPHQLEEAIKLVETFPNQKFILDHGAKPYIKAKKIKTWQAHLKQLSRFENVACKVSGLATEADWKNWNKATIKPYLDVVFDVFGSKRTLFGSDWPVSLLTGNYDTTVALVEEYISKFSEAEQKQIMGLNAKEWYQLKD